MTLFFKSPLEKDELSSITEALGKGQLVVVPTETVYGLAADAFSPSAIQAIFDAKKRPANNPVIVHIASVKDLENVVANIPPIALQLADAFWPGPLTMIFEKSDAIPSAVCAGGSTVGIRVPRQKTTQQIIEAFGPIAAPSANLYTQLSPTDVKELNDALINSVTIIVDGGPCEVGIESTVLSVVDNVPVLLRPGMVSRQDISDVINRPVIYKPKSVEENESRPSPGLAKKHYAPQTQVVVGLPDETSKSRNVGYISHTTTPTSFFVKNRIRLTGEPAEYASEIYSALHLLDRLELDVIYVEPLPKGEEWQALRDRLDRASD